MQGELKDDGGAGLAITPSLGLSTYVSMHVSRYKYEVMHVCHCDEVAMCYTDLCVSVWV